MIPDIYKQLYFLRDCILILVSGVCVMWMVTEIRVSGMRKELDALREELRRKTGE